MDAWWSERSPPPSGVEAEQQRRGMQDFYSFSSPVFSSFCMWRSGDMAQFGGSRGVGVGVVSGSLVGELEGVLLNGSPWNDLCEKNK